MMRRLLAAFVLALGSAAAAQAEPIGQVLKFEDLSGWAQDDHEQALRVFTQTCGDLKAPDWTALCRVAKEGPNAKSFFEVFFKPVLVEDGTEPLLTGYFEPEILGSAKKEWPFLYPVYRKPPELRSGESWLDRATIESSDVLSGRGLEIAWVDDPTALFYLQVQGSGRIRMQDGSVIRIGYAASNGKPYRSPGMELVRRGIFTEHEVSANVVANWVERNGAAGLDLLRNSPNYVFFRVINGMDSSHGPRGAMNRSLTPGRTLAIDPEHYRLGAPIWMEKGGADPMTRLMIAQDTGSAIKGAQRADFFAGTGTEAGRFAAKLSDPVRLITLVPITRAFALAEEAGQ